MDLTSSIVDITDALKAYLQAGVGTIGIASEDIRYGYTGQIPTFPALSLENVTKRRNIKATRQWEIHFTADIVVYHGKIQDAQINEREENVITEAVEDYMNLTRTLDGLVISSHVRASDSVVVRNFLRARRLLWWGLSQQNYPN